MSAAYRVRQFVQAVGAWVRPPEVDEALLARCLPPEAAKLFRAMPRYDRRHSLGVARSLQEMGHDEPDLLAAALLHDVGKTALPDARLRLGHRVAIVLMRALWPNLLERLGQERSAGWRRPFYVQLCHAEIGADLARQAGCSPRTAESATAPKGSCRPGSARNRHAAKARSKGPGFARRSPVRRRR